MKLSLIVVVIVVVVKASSPTFKGPKGRLFSIITNTEQIYVDIKI